MSPVAAFVCPSEKEKAGEHHTIEYCVLECREKCFSPQMMTAIWWANVKNPHRGRYISATSLDGCVRKLVLERTKPYAEEFNRLWASFRGTMTHVVLEEAAEAVLPSGKRLIDLGVLTEWSMKIGFCFQHGGFPIDPEVDVDDLATYALLDCPLCHELGITPRDQDTIILGGTLDCGFPVFRQDEDGALVYEADGLVAIYVEEDGTAYYNLDDLKTVKDSGIRFMVPGDPKNTLHPQVKDAYVAQARLYAYMASICPPPPALTARGVKRIKFITSNIQFFAMGDAPYTGSPIFRWKKDWREPVKDWPMYPVDLASVEWVEDYIRERARERLDALVLGKARGSVADPEVQEWLCSLCAFFGSTYCPNPALEHKMVAAGLGPEEAFREARQSPVEIPDPVVGDLTEGDTLHIDNFFRRQRGEPLREKKPATKSRRGKTTK